MNWDLWPGYESLNLGTGAVPDTNVTFKGSAPAFSLGMGAEYPLGFFELGIGAEFSYMYLNFTNVAWYNGDDEVVATSTGTEDGRVDLDFSGFRGKFEIRRYFSW